MLSYAMTREYRVPVHQYQNNAKGSKRTLEPGRTLKYIFHRQPVFFTSILGTGNTSKYASFLNLLLCSWVFDP